MIFLLLIGIIKCLIDFPLTLASDKTWTYELKSVETESSNPDIFNISLRIERLSRGVFGLSGEWKFDIDIVEGDTNEVELKSFRSSNNDGIYSTLPLEMSRRHFFKALNTQYKEILMSTLKDCSDLPHFEDEFVPPLEKKTYVLDKCQISQDGLPNHIESGTYKIILKGYGDIEWQIELLAEVMPN